MSKKLRILLVEDSAADAELMERALRDASVEFTMGRVQTRDEFLHALRQNPPNIVLTDFSLPSFNGMEALTLLRQEDPDLPYISLSGTINEEQVVELIRHGATDCISKNNLAKLAPAIERALREVEHKHHKRLAEASLRESEARFRAIFEGAGTGIAVEDLQGQIIETNRTLQQMLGYSGEELQQLTRWHFTHGANQQEDQEQIGKLIADESEHFEAEKHFVRKDGRIISGRMRVSMVRTAEGHPQFALVMIEDITERQRAEEAHQQYAAIVEFSTDAIISQTFDGIIFSWNPAAERVYGYTASEANGRSISIIVPPEREPELSQVLERIKEGERVDMFETTRRRKDGTLIDVSVTTSPIKDLSGKIIGASAISRDITERKQAEIALRESEENYRKLVELSPDGIFIESEGKFVFVNSAALAIVGARTPAEIIGKAAFDLVHPDCHEDVRVHHAQLEAGHDVPMHESKLIRMDGSVLDVEATAIPFVFRSKPAYQVVVRDITERKRAEEALRNSEASLARAQQIAHLGSWELDLRTRMLIWSDETYRIFGVERGEREFPEEVYFRRVHPDDRDLVRRTISAALQSRGQYKLDYRIVLPNGETKNVSAQAELVLDEKGTPIRCQGTVLDITERKRAENFSAAFSKLGQRLSSATNAVEAARIIADEADKLFGWDACDLQLCSLDLQTWQTVYCMDLIDGVRRSVVSDRPTRKPTARMRLVLEQGAQLFSEEGIAAGVEARPFGDKGKHSASIMYVPVRNGSKIVGIFSIHSYSSHAYSKKDLESLQALGDHCGGALERIRVETDRKNLEVQLRQSQKMESIGQLAGGIAHDFNNILTVIQGHSSLLTMGGDLSQDAKESAQQIAVASERAANLTRQLLTFSRRQVMQPKNLDLNEVVNNMTKMLRRLLGEDITLHVSYTPCLPLVHADLGMMEQILMNLSVNSRDAMPKGGRLFINTSVFTADSAYSEEVPEALPGEYVCLTVKDTGVGIPPEVLPHIFEPFFTTKDIGKGTGLGLATVYGIVQQHRGWVKASSTVNKETVVQIFLPVVEGKSGAAAELPEPTIRGGDETILVVEDEPPLRILVRSVLERYGYRVLEAASGLAALITWEQHKGEIQLLLTDMVMPHGVSGRELAEKLLEDNRDLKVIYSSGYSLAVVGKDMVLQEGLNFLQKPYHPRKLAQAVRDCLDG
jgi:PAS domain S-box-containing protein